MLQVGDSIMLYLLSHTDIFHPLPRRCFVQVAGTSVILAAEHSTSESFNSDMLGSSRGKKGIGILKSRKGKASSNFFAMQECQYMLICNVCSYFCYQKISLEIELKHFFDAKAYEFSLTKYLSNLYY